jgi:ribosomal protein S27AE
MELISRDDAIKCLDGNVLITEQKEAEAVKEYFEMVIARLKALPTIEERKEGKWIDDTYIDEVYDIKGVKTWGTKAKCSECGFSKIFIERHGGQYEFCPRCGARMKGE